MGKSETSNLGHRRFWNGSFCTSITIGVLLYVSQKIFREIFFESVTPIAATRCTIYTQLDAPIRSLVRHFPVMGKGAPPYDQRSDAVESFRTTLSLNSGVYEGYCRDS